MKRVKLGSTAATTFFVLDDVARFGVFGDVVAFVVLGDEIWSP